MQQTLRPYVTAGIAVVGAVSVDLTNVLAELLPNVF
jgi:hypothetical protein